MSKENLLEKRAFELTVGEFIKAIVEELKEESLVNIAPEESYIHKGIIGIMEIFQCSKSKATAIRASGIIDDACIQNGNSFLIDKRTALNLMKSNSNRYPVNK